MKVATARPANPVAISKRPSTRPTRRPTTSIEASAPRPRGLVAIPLCRAG